MVTVKINGTPYKVCTSWDDVTDVTELLKAEDFKDELIALSTIPRETIESADELSLFPLYTLISFLDDIDSIDPLQARSVARSKYERMELAKTFLKDGKQWKRIYLAAKVYYPKEKNPSRLLSLGVNIVSQIATFLSNYRDMLEHEPDQEEEAAGIDDLSGFGSFGTVYNLAGKDLTKVREIYAKPAIEVYTALHYSFREAKYMRALHEIRNRKK